MDFCHGDNTGTLWVDRRVVAYGLRLCHEAEESWDRTPGQGREPSSTLEALVMRLFGCHDNWFRAFMFEIYHDIRTTRSECRRQNGAYQHPEYQEPFSNIFAECDRQWYLASADYLEAGKTYAWSLEANGADIDSMELDLTIPDVFDQVVNYMSDEDMIDDFE